MAIDLRDGVFGPPLEARAPAPEMPPELQAAEARERAEEDAVFVAATRARLGADQARAFKSEAARARETGGAGFADTFVNGVRVQANDAVDRARAPDFPGPTPSDDAVDAFLDRAEQDTDRFIDRAAVVETMARAGARRRDGLAALDAVRQAAFDDPDGFDGALSHQADVIDALAPMLGGDAAAALAASERARLAESAVRGRIATAPDFAMRELDDPGRFPDLPDDRRAAMRDSAERHMQAAERDLDAAADETARAEVLRLAAEERRFSADFLAKAESGAAREIDLEDAVDRGVITPANAESLRAARAAEERRRQDRLDLVTTAQQAIDQGEGLDPDDPRHIAAADAYWDDVILPSLRELPPRKRPREIVRQLADIFIVPDGAMRSMRAMWDSGVPDLQVAIAKTLHVPRKTPPQGLADVIFTLFSPRDLAIQSRVLDLTAIGLEPEAALERAEALEPPNLLPAPGDPGEPQILLARSGDGPFEATPLAGDGELEARAGRAEGAATDDNGEDVVTLGEDSTNDASSDSLASGASPEGPTQSAQASDDENPWQLKPDQQKEAKENFGKITKGEVQTLDRQQKTTVLKSLWRPSKKLTGAQRRVVAEIFRTTDFDEEFQKQEAAKRAEFVERFRRDPVILKVDPRKWSSVSNEEKLAIFDRILEMQAKVYGYPKPKLELRNLGGKRGARGNFDEKTETVQINPLHNNFPAQMGITLGVVAHEGQHAYQLQLKKDLAAGNIKSNDPRSRAVELLTLNTGNMEFPGSAGDIYDNQPAERHARPMNIPIEIIINKRRNERVGVGRSQ